MIMGEMVTISMEDLRHLEERARKCALDKSYLQLIIRLMNKVGAASGLDDTIDSMLRNILDVIGGGNIILYYWIDGMVCRADVYGLKSKLDAVDDELVQQVIFSRQPLEKEQPFSDTMMLTPEFTEAYTWIYPLLVEPDLIGILKMENLHIGMRDMYHELPTFFTFTALVLKNEILGQSQLRQAYDQLSESNMELELEIEERQRAEEELRRAKVELEEQVAKRTQALYEANVRLTRELAEKEQAEVALRRAAAELDDLYNQAPCGYHSLDRNGLFIRMNDTELCWLGYDRTEVIGKKTFMDLITESSKQIFLQKFPEFKARGWVRDLEFELIRKDGSVLPVLLSATAITDEDGHFLMSRSTVYDHSARKEAEKALQQLNVELEHRVQERTADLDKKNKDLQQMNRVFVGRELKMVELKKRISELEHGGREDN